MVITTRKQREAIKRLYDRAHYDSVPFNTKYPSYRHFRRAVSPTFGCDGAVTVEWCGMWVCIERDGYTHS